MWRDTNYAAYPSRKSHVVRRSGRKRTKTRTSVRALPPRRQQRERGQG